MHGIDILIFCWNSDANNTYSDRPPANKMNSSYTLLHTAFKMVCLHLFSAILLCAIEIKLYFLRNSLDNSLKFNNV